MTMKIFFVQKLKNLFCILPVLLCSFIQAQNVNIPDVNFKNALISVGVDTNNDGEIQVTEAQAIDNVLNLENKNISDLTGIKAFINVKIIYGRYNNLTSIDMSGMTNLQNLGLAYNDLITANLSGMTNLKGLSLDHNNLTSFNLNGATNLRNFYCNNNQLTSFDSSNLTGAIFLDYFNIGNNPLSSVHIANFPSLTYFTCANNQVPSTFTFNNLPNINRIYLDNSKVTSIQLGGPQTLKILSLQNNLLESISFQDGFLQNLQYLNLSSNPIQFICKDSYDVLPANPNIPQLTSGCILSTQEVLKKDKNLIIYPNPSKDYINFSDEVKQIKIYSSAGTLVFDKKDNKDSKINISHLPAGVYFVTTEFGNSKFIKE